MTPFGFILYYLLISSIADCYSIAINRAGELDVGLRLVISFYFHAITSAFNMRSLWRAWKRGR